ncbi:hypothetical protein TWF694_003216 [Orbilia ellipsospora]|uniref:NADPH-dependent FMN reductase-like domain-containing protein n=1 Tax=Orbilia ellipsospora TaxID=2528407 RepID=A0AAV9X185_9PEZI
MAVGKSTTKSVALILGSVRAGRNGPRVAKLVTETIQKNLPEEIELKVIDLAEWNFPIFDQAEIPFTVKGWENYTSEITRNWSREISGHDGFIFLVPEYNSSYAGPLKNAFDYLYNEWAGKTAVLINYGARPVNALRGGSHFNDVISDLQMKVSSLIPKISVSTMDREKTAAGDDLVFYEESVKQQVQADIATAWDEAVKSLLTAPASA